MTLHRRERGRWNGCRSRHKSGHGGVCLCGWLRGRAAAPKERLEVAPPNGVLTLHLIRAKEGPRDMRSEG